MQIFADKHDKSSRNHAFTDLAIDGTDALIVVLDEAGCIVSFNKACEEVTGYRRAEVAGKAIEDLFLTDSDAGAEAVKPALRDATRQQESFWITKDHRLRRIVWSNTTVPGPEDTRYLIKVGIDITEGLQVEEELRNLARTLEGRVAARTQELQENQRILDSLISNLPGMVYRCRRDAELSMEYVSEGAFPLTGYHAADFVSGRIRFAQLVHPEDRRFVDETIAAGMRENRPFQLEYRLITANGREKWVWERGSASRTGPIALEGFISDITQRKTAEQKIRMSEARLAEAQRIAQLGNWEWDITDNTLNCSDETFRIFGLEPRAHTTVDDLVGCVHPADRDQVREAVDRALSGKGTYAIDHRILLANGDERIVHVHGEATFDAAGHPLRMLGTVQDITERKRMEMALARSNEELERRVEERTARLQESEERFRQLAENISEVFWMTSPDGNEILYVSPGYEQIWGRRTETLYLNPRAWLEAVHPADRSRVAAAFDRYIGAGTFDEEFRIIRPDGSVRWIRNRAFAVRNSDGQIYRIAGIAEDITDQQEARQALNESREQLRRLALHQEADREALRTRIAREIHDELGQALMALNLDLHWLMKNCEDRERVLQKGREMQRLIEQTARTVQEISAELRPIILDDLGLEAALSWHVEQFESKSGLECQKFISLGDKKFADEYATTLYRLLQEALTNILRHAQATACAVRVTCHEDHVSMVIRDNGIGITPDKVMRSDAFGLIGMRERVGALQGNFDIHGEPGRGTTVSIALPLAAPGCRET